MEPEGPPLAPGDPTNDKGSRRTAEVSGSASLGEERNNSVSWLGTGEGVGGADPGREGSQRRFRSFPSSLTWDSDSERETIDEEDLQHFANPHGLANHSPGYHSSGPRHDGENDQTPAHLQHLPGERDGAGPSDSSDGNQRTAKTQEPNVSQPGQGSRTQLVEGNVWKVPDTPEPNKVKPKECCQTQTQEEQEKPGDGEVGIHNKGKHQPEGVDAKEPSPDVYTFPGDSDAESPPPASWAHCTFVQRQRRKKVLLRPFSGLVGPQHGGGASYTVTRTLTPQGARAGGDEGMSFGEKERGEEEVQEEKEEEMPKGEEENMEGEGPGQEEGAAGGGGNHDSDEVDGPSQDIFTCVECSIYFQKQVHLQEHMSEHVQSPLDSSGWERQAKVAHLHCAECGWTLPSRADLVEHRSRHQESRARILVEIQKLEATGAEKLGEMQKVAEGNAVDPVCLDVSGVAEPHPVLGPVKGLDPEVPVNSPAKTLALAPGLADLDPALVLCADPLTPRPKAGPARTPVRAKAAPAKGRRFICPTCNFSTKTSQAMANHAKTHNRTKPPVRRKSQRAAFPAMEPPCMSPAAQSGSTSSALAFVTSSLAPSKEHPQPEEGPGQPRSVLDPSTFKAGLDREPQLAPGYLASTNRLEGRYDPGPTKELVFKCIGNRRAIRRDRAWTQTGARLESKRGLGVLDEEDDGAGRGAVLEDGEETESSGKLRSHARPAFTQDDSGLVRQSSTPSSPLGKHVKEEEEEEEEEEQGAEQNCRLSFLRRRNHILLAPAEDDSEEDGEEIDEEQMQRFLSEAILDEEEEEEMDEETGRLKSVERKCPYCPDRFHNGIGLANHVRGHLNRVGVSYNVRHFISAEEVNAIEKKFSYQKKRKKVANFDPDTFSVMRCEFCGAGFDTRAGLSSHARAHLRDFGILNWDVTVSPIHILREMFSRRPDLVIPTAPPRSPLSPAALDPCGDEDEEEDDDDDEEENEEEVDKEEQEDEEDEEEQRRPKKVKSEEETGGGVAGAKVTTFGVPPSHWRRLVEDGDAGGQAGIVEEDEEEELLRIPVPDAVGSSGAQTDASRLSPREDADDKAAPPDLTCRVCGLRFETRRGLSSHARSHLRQLGVSEGSGAPINLLYRVIQERLNPSDPSGPGQDRDFEEDMDFEEKPLPLSILAKMAPSSSPSSSSSSLTSVLMGPPGAYPPRLLPSVVRKAPISSLLPVSSPLRSPDHKVAGVKAVTSNLSGALDSLASTTTTTKPFWAPQESDAPLNLTLEGDPNKDIICQLCGAWFETRKGLSSHARAHLRHFGVEYSESKGSPITLLNQLIHTDDFKHKASVLQSHPSGHQGFSASKRPLLTSASSSSLLFKGAGSPSSKATSMSSLLGPPAKRAKSSIQVFRLSSGELLTLPHNEPPKEIGCEFCGEFFENRKGLSSHARSHLRQMGITEWSVNGSPIDTLREVIAKRGLPCAAAPLKPRKTPPPSSPGPPRSPLSAGSSSSPPSSAPLLGRLPFSFVRPSSPQPVGCKTSPARPPSTSPASASSSGSLVLKPKPEPEQLEVTMPGAVGASGGFPAEPLNCSWGGADNLLPLNLVVSHEAEPTREIQCEFCGEFFENRKGLSSHARSHLRQMGITEWSVNGSPIDTLREVMQKRGGASAAPAATPSEQAVKKESGWQGAASPPWESGPEGPPGIPAFPLSKFRKSPLSLLHSRLQKQGAAGSGLVGGLSPGGKGFQVSPQGNRAAALEEAGPGQAGQLSPLLPKALSALTPGFCFKRKSSPDKHGASPQDASCELCGFYFENRKALASHARAHLRQFGVTEWCVNGSPIETLSAWMRTRPQKVLEMHRSYMQVNRSSLKKKNISPLSPSSDHMTSTPNLKPSSSSSSSSSSHWPSMGGASGPPRQPRSQPSGAASPADFLSVTPHGAGTRPAPGGRSPSHQSTALPLHAQVARSELNVRLPRGFERRPLKHPSLPEGAERESSCAPKPPRSGTIPSLVPQPPSYPLVKLVGALYTLKCRFCEVEFHGPLSIQEDWIRHLQQHIIKMNYSKPDVPRGPASTDPPSPKGPASSDPTTPIGSASSDPSTPRGPVPPAPKTPKSPTSNEPAAPRGPSSSDPALLQATATADTPTHRGPISTDPLTQQSPASTDPAKPGGPLSTNTAIPRALSSPSPTAAPQSTDQAEDTLAGPPAQKGESSSPPEEEPGPVAAAHPACVSTSSTATTVAVPPDAHSHRPPAGRAPAVPGAQGPEFPGEGPLTDSALTPGPDQPV